MRGPDVRPAPRHRDHRGATATGIRLAELAALRYEPGDLQSNDLDLRQREITVRGKGGRDRIVKIGHQAAAAWTGTSAPAPATPGPGGRSCGWVPVTGSS